MRALLLVALLTALPVLAGCAFQAPEPPIGPAGEGETRQAPSWHFVDTNGTTHSAETARGSPSVLFFFATWCSSCRGLTDDLAAIEARYGDVIDLYSISFDPTESEEDFEDWKERYEQDWPHGSDPEANARQAFGIRSQSSVVVLDAEGHVVQAWGYGQASEGSIAAAIEAALGG